MKSHSKLALVFALFVFGSPVVSAQLPPPVIDPIESEMHAVTIFGNLAETYVTGSPYSAIEESIYSSKDPDGTYANRTRTVTHIYRDWDGRTRAERFVTSYLWGKSETHLESIYIADPAAGAVYRLDPENLIATRHFWNGGNRPLSGDVEFTGPCMVESPKEQFPVVTESLGTRTLEGLTVEGIRQTVRAPLGSSLGNDKEIDVVVETWISSELKVAMLTKKDNSATGRDITQLTKIDRSEPDPGLFQVPANYKIENDGRVVSCGPPQP